MNETDTGIEKETIPFLINSELWKLKIHYLEARLKHTYPLLSKAVRKNCCISYRNSTKLKVS